MLNAENPTEAKRDNRESTNDSDGAGGRRKEISERTVKIKKEESEGWVPRRTSQTQETVFAKSWRQKQSRSGWLLCCRVCVEKWQ